MHTTRNIHYISNVATNDILNEHAASINRRLSNHSPVFTSRDSHHPIRAHLQPPITTTGQSQPRHDKHTYYIGKGHIICLLINLGSCKMGDLHWRSGGQVGCTWGSGGLHVGCTWAGIQWGRCWVQSFLLLIEYIMLYNGVCSEV